MSDDGRLVCAQCGSPIALRQPDADSSREKAKHLSRLADRLCVLILNPDFPDIDIEIEKAKLREEALRLFPRRGYLYRMIYESRFKRLAEQFRPRARE